VRSSTGSSHKAGRFRCSETQPGFRGVLFSAAGAARIVITLWDDAEAAAALDTSETYAETVAAIVATGFLRGESTVEVFDVEDFYVEQNFAGNES
jgi:heme-degrading monooxygenase HmoA